MIPGIGTIFGGAEFGKARKLDVDSSLPLQESSYQIIPLDQGQLELQFDLAFNWPESTLLFNPHCEILLAVDAVSRGLPLEESSYKTAEKIMQKLVSAQGKLTYFANGNKSFGGDTVDGLAKLKTCFGKYLRDRGDLRRFLLDVIAKTDKTKLSLVILLTDRSAAELRQAEPLFQEIFARHFQEKSGNGVLCYILPANRLSESLYFWHLRLLSIGLNFGDTKVPPFISFQYPRENIFSFLERHCFGTAEMYQVRMAGDEACAIQLNTQAKTVLLAHQSVPVDFLPARCLFRVAVTAEMQLKNKFLIDRCQGRVLAYENCLSMDLEQINWPAKVNQSNRSKIDVITYTVRSQQLAVGGIPASIEKRGRDHFESPEQPFTSNLGAEDIGVLHSLGLRPIGLVRGTAAWGIGEVTVGFQDGPVAALDEAFQKAAQVAYQRLRQEVMALSACGAVSVRMQISPLDWERKLVEVHFSGTAVVPWQSGSQLGKVYQTQYCAADPFFCSTAVRELWYLMRYYRPVDLSWGITSWFMLSTLSDELVQKGGFNVEIEHWSHGLAKAKNACVRQMQERAFTGRADGVLSASLLRQLTTVRMKYYEYDATTIREHFVLLLSTFGTTVKQVREPQIEPKSVKLSLSLLDQRLTLRN